MPRITKAETTLNGSTLHLLGSTSEAPSDVTYDGAGTNNRVAPMVDLGDLADEWNEATFHDYDQTRESFLLTFKSVQELEITLPYRPSEAAQAAIITAFNTRANLIFAVITKDNDVTPNEDQLTFTCQVKNYNNMFSGAKDDRAVCSISLSIVGDVAYSARVT